MSNFTTELCQLLKIKQNVSTAFHPCTNGQSEKMNQWVEQYLKTQIQDDPHGWSDMLPMAEFTHNRLMHEKMGASPHFLLNGSRPRFDASLEASHVPEVHDHIKELEGFHKKLKEKL